jgi:hypothetical protein
MGFGWWRRYRPRLGRRSCGGPLASTGEGKAWTLTAAFREFSDGRQYFPAVPEQDADVLEVLIGKMGKNRDVDAVLRKRAGVLGHAELCEPIGYFLHRRPRPAEFGLVDPLDGRFYPIDRAARNRPERSVAGLTGGRARRATDGSRPRVRRGRRLKMQPMLICPGRAIRGVQVSYKPFPCTMLATEGQNMTTSAERMRALRERQRRGLRRLTIDVSEDDLRAIAKRG